MTVGGMGFIPERLLMVMMMILALWYLFFVFPVLLPYYHISGNVMNVRYFSVTGIVKL